MKQKIKKYSQSKKEYRYPQNPPKTEPMLLRDSQTLTISPQGQITIPKAWREALGFKPGVKIVAWFKEKAGETSITLAAEPENWVEKFAGISTGTWGSSEEIDDYVRKIRDEWER